MKNDMPIYKYEMLCRNNLQEPLNDGNITLIVNSYCERDGLEPEIETFLEYVKSGKLVAGDKLIEDIEKEIKLIKTLEDCEVGYMSFEEKIEDAFEEGVLSNLVSLVEEKLLDINIASEKAGMSVEDFTKLLEKKN